MIVSFSLSVNSCITTESAPLGIIAPVMTSIVSPTDTSVFEIVPAVIESITFRVTYDPSEIVKVSLACIA
ncbi:MAG: hypothetical protein BWX56_01498 [Euryarchaeota archaeon ADurb.Bin023]|nr:MAG: hypothetical protein BWX56_01498 [Euryarchaeota archaeon ADurb.Bin023]